jgi:predicted Zn finger-like uncharacterized protein
MQFGCESCKAQLQIADEKVRGRRLIVRCRRCGAKIALADPALSDSSPRLISAASAPRPMRIVPRPEPGSDPGDPEEESTRAMDSDVLERALQASMAEGPQNGSPPTRKLHFPPPAVPLDGPIWYAMLHGKQTGPVTWDELHARADDGEVGPRTYVWREGMAAWQRAKDIPELGEMFPQLPPPPAPRSSAPPAQPAPPRPEEPRPAPQPEPSRDAAPAANAPGPPAGEPAANADSASAPPGIVSPVVGRVTPMFESAAPNERGPFLVFLGLIALAAAAIVLWVGLATSPQETREQSADSRPPQQPAPIPQPAPEAQAAPAGLTAEQVSRKLDENKSSLQGCVDDALRRDPQLKLGKIHVATTIAPTGEVTAARIDQPGVDESALGACLRTATTKIVFPRFDGAAFDVDIPIVVQAGR